MFTDTLSRTPSRSHSPICRTASRNTQLVSSLMYPVCSANGMNRAGETSPAPPLAGGVVNTEPKLQPVDGSVIIRRGDTLWRISRRVYGRGVRFSTIYLANQDQISDPDRIWPGQVFKVPEKSKEGEAADLKAMGDQMTTPPAKTQ